MTRIEGTLETEGFGRILRQYREHAGLGQERLAERAGLSVPAISNLERGVSRPRLETVTLLAEALALPDEHRAALRAAALRERTRTSSPAPPAAVVVSPRHNLPVPPNALLGREWEVAAVRAALQAPATRLLTLSGPGGVGKSRLALSVGAELVAQYPDGVWLVELASLADPTLVPAAVTEVLGLREERSQPLTTTLVEHLRDRQLLLVMDNCEHLLSACTALASALLRAGAGVRILATSRERLGISGEQVHPVPTLNVPDSHHLPPPELLGSYEAVRLFVARAQARWPAFALSEQNARAVVTICARLDGLPLALELAAARVGSLPVEVIAARLDERFGLLTLGPRDVQPRQQTLRATMDWSWELLSGAEQLLLRRLAVFACGWTLAAAQALCAGLDFEEEQPCVVEDAVPSGEAWAVLDLLDGLVSKSLVQVEHLEGEGARYRLLETVRQYAGERLEEAGELGVTRELHLAWCVAQAQAATAELSGAEQGIWLARLEREHDNLRAALSWAREQQDDRGLRLAAALCRFWNMRGYLREGREWLERALDATGPTPAGLRAAALKGAGNLALSQGEYGQAAALCEAALALFRAHADVQGMADSLTTLGIVADRQGDYGRAAALFERAVVLARERGDTRQIARTLGNLAAAWRRQGDHEREAALYNEALDLFQALGDRRSIAVALDNLGLVACRRGEYGRAAALHEESLCIARELGVRHGVVISLINLGAVAARQGDHDRSTARLREGLLLGLEIGARDEVAEILERLSWMAAACGHAVRAIHLGAAAEVLWESLSVPLAGENRVDHDRAVHAARALLGEEAFAAAWAAGRALSFDEAVALALEPDASWGSLD
jgi:non-specific serine/threonine protein kinase